MWPPVSADASWSAGFDRFVRNVVIVCVAGAIGALAGGLGVFAAIGSSKTSPARSGSVDVSPAAEQTKPTASAAIAAAAPRAQPIVPSRTTQVKPAFGNRWSAHGTSARTMVPGAVPPRDSEPAPSQAASNQAPTQSAAAVLEAQSNDAAVPSDRQNAARSVGAPMLQKKPPPPVASAAPGAKQTRPQIAASQKPATPRVTPGRPQPQQVRNPLGVLFGTLFGVPRASMSN